MTTEDLQKAIMLVRSNNKKEALPLLSGLVKVEPKNELAWFWLSVCVETDEQKIFCLKKVIDINPSNNNAILALEKLSKLPQPTIEDIIPSSQNITPQPPPINLIVSQPKQEKDETNSTPVGLVILVWLFVILSFFTSGLLSILLAIFIIIGAIFLMANNNRTAKINGFMIGILWLFTCIIGYIQGMSNY